MLYMFVVSVRHCFRLLISIAILISRRCFCFAEVQDIDLDKSRLWGPGIENPDLTLPVRYFYLQLVDKRGTNFTSPVSNFISFNIGGDGVLPERKHCFGQTDVIDTKYGSYILRYKLLVPCKTVEIQVKTAEGQWVAGTPILKSGNPIFYPDECSCPIKLEEWTKLAHCPQSYRQIDWDVGQWQEKSVNFSKILAEAKERWASRPGAYSFCRYSFRKNNIYRKCYGQHVGFKMFADAAFLSAARKFRLPDTDLLMNLGDWPLEKRSKEAEEGIVPMVSWCGSTETSDLILPTYELMEATLESLGRTSLDIHTIQGLTGPPWSQKIPKGFFRGRDSRQERLDLVEIARKHPDLLEAGITKFFFFRDVMDRYGPEVKHVGLDEFFKRRYLISVDGTVAAYRLPYYLVGDSLVLKQDSPYYEFFYGDLKPWVHYVPLKRDLSDVVEKLKWARDKEEEVLRIVSEAQNFARSRLQPSEMFCYYARFFEAYRKLLMPTDSSIPEDLLEVVEQPKYKFHCSCREELSEEYETFNKDEL